MAQVYTWKKLASAKWEDAWVERLAFIGPTRLAITSLRGSRSLRLAAYGLSRREAEEIVSAFGGQSAPQRVDFIRVQAQPRPPIRVRNRLLIVDRTGLEEPGKRTLVIPAGMAFGTGDHATTSSCLRRLCDVSRGLEDWEMLDLGTGSGILALAARALGARRVEAFDFDPAAIRIARENLALNHLDRVTFHRLDVTRWTPSKRFQVVAANLFSEVLISAAPAIVSAVTPGGALILSGILRHQEGETLRAFTTGGLATERVVRKGKWIAAQLRSSL